MTKNIKEITEKLEAGVKEVFSSEQFKNYLDFMNSFTDYSINNTILIYMQKPDASLVAGYKSWQKKGRQVRKGEHGIKIIAPRPRQMEVEEDGETKIVALPLTFHAITVFDVSQTEGAELPEGPVTQLTGDVDGYAGLIGKLEAAAPVPVSYEAFDISANGYYSDAAQQIVIKSGLSELQTVKTLVHEIAHSMLHTGKDTTDRDTREVQAESIAYTVCSMLGLDTSDYSFGYIAGWSSGKDVKELTESIEIIKTTAREILDRIA